MRITTGIEDSEREVVAKMLIGGAFTVSEVAAVMDDADVSQPAYAEVFRVIVHLQGQLGPESAVDRLMLRDGLVPWWKRNAPQPQRNMATLERFVESLFDGSASADNVTYYAEKVRSKAVMARAKASLSALLTEGDTWTGTHSEYIQEIQRRAMSLSAMASSDAKDRLDPLETEMPEFWQELRENYDDPAALMGITTGFKEIDRHIHGLRPGQLVIVAAQSSHGKSTLVGNIGINAAEQAQKHVAAFSLEMDRKELLERYTFSKANVDPQAYYDHRLTEEEWVRLRIAYNTLLRLPFWINDNPRMSVAKVAQILRRQKFLGRLDLAIIDYLQIMTPNQRGRGESRQEEVSAIGEDLKHLARELRIPIIAPCQLNDDGRVRESRALFHHADVFLQLETEEDGTVTKEGDYMNYEALLTKVRGGKKGRVSLKFYPHFLRFEEAITNGMF